jgi:hypothetical protein
MARGSIVNLAAGGRPIAVPRSARRETRHAPGVFDADDDPALWQYARQALPVATFFALRPPAGPALLTIPFSSRTG